MRVTVEHKYCGCHPETCNCSYYYVYVDGERTRMGDDSHVKLYAMLDNLYDALKEDRLEEEKRYVR